MKPIDLAYHILNNYKNVSNGGITPLKLQKLLYYIYVWGIVSNNKIIEAKFQKWSYGPVIKEVYEKFSSFGKSPITPIDIDITLNGDKNLFIDFVVSNYIDFDAITLSSMTHQDDPWKLTPSNQTINENLIKDYYSTLNFAKNFPIDYDKKYYPVETDMHYSFILDFANSQDSKISYSSYNEYLKIKEKSDTEFDNKFGDWLEV